MAVFVRNLGIIRYNSALSLQTKLVKKYKEKDQHYAGELLLCQHDPPVYTFGLRERDTEERARELRALGADVMKVRRGGLTTVHSKGQLVCYPILNLHKLKLGVRSYIKGLEQAVIDTCGRFDVLAHRTDNVGVWVGDSKVCQIGVQVSSGVTYHGLALNCVNDLCWFNHIVPCGLEGKEVTSLSQLLNRDISVNEVAPILIESLVKEFQLVAAETKTWNC